MSGHVTLLGTEDVNRAANRMQQAAEEMRRAAESIEDTLRQFSQRMDEWVVRLEALHGDPK